MCKYINSISDGKQTITKEDKDYINKNLNIILGDILGLKEENTGNNTSVIDGMMGLIMDIRAKARNEKDYVTSDKIRDVLKSLGIEIKDGKDGATWRLM